ncbi:hypothetical protein H696_05915 [Fonticula alba]|uniref:DNA/RNA-binding protein Alba-like domain-containing protein n=1 Tax=Fonticula alba TaxID=691883 RepID=A0A058Z123_FONAL|nr:hypothetical protein H696_05915 [Fonticula alba]KCV67628.1 hypothetical protein H696_05915 [Fonticula alba]|eukprot:XP_009497966.1 hypothetical protein H696_05915 [Fonticula alba]
MRYRRQMSRALVPQSMPEARRLGPQPVSLPPVEALLAWVAPKSSGTVPAAAAAAASLAPEMADSPPSPSQPPPPPSAKSTVSRRPASLQSSTPLEYDVFVRGPGGAGSRRGGVSPGPGARRASDFRALLSRAQRNLDRHRRVRIHALGPAIERALAVALALRRQHAQSALACSPAHPAGVPVGAPVPGSGKGHFDRAPLAPGLLDCRVNLRTECLVDDVTPQDDDEAASTASRLVSAVTVEVFFR